MRILLLLFGVSLAVLSCQTKPSSKPTSAQLVVPREFYKGLYFYDSTTKADSAFFYFFNITKSSADSLIRAMSYGYMAEIQQAVGDFLNVQENAIAGLKLLKGDTSVNESYCRASLYNNLGRSYVGLKNYDEAIKYYKQALMVPTDNENQNIYRNNIAVALREKGNFKEALDSFLTIPLDPNETKQSFARRTTNLASLKWKAYPTFNPLPDLHNALNIRIHAKDGYGVTASYNHLSAYYQSTNKDSALFYAHRMYANAQKTNNPDDRLEALKKLVDLSPATESKRSFEIYEHLRDSLQTNQNNAKNQFVAILYESEKSKAENLGLQKENARKELQILRQRIYTYGSILLALLIVGLAVWHYRKKRQQTRLEAQASIKENQLKISQKIHDTVANGLYRVMSEIEHVETIDKEPLLDKIEELYERSRDISYEPIEKENDTTTRINQIINPFATPATKISVVGNKEELWNGIPSMIVKELEQVLQELMVNMKKHSEARNVVLNFANRGETLEINYKDDGRGFSPNFRKGNGLKSTGNRINRIGGQITFAEETASGAAIKSLYQSYPMIKKVLIAEDQESANISVQRTLEVLGAEEVDYVYYCDDALLKITHAKKSGDPYDLLICDLYFEPDGRPQKISGGAKLIPAVREVQPELKVLIFSAENKPAVIDSLFKNQHIDGYVRKARNDAKELQLAFEKISRNQQHYPKHLADLVKHQHSYNFTDLDVMIISYLAEGILIRNIPDNLLKHQIECSLSKVEKSLRQMKDVFEFTKNEQLIAFCKDMGII